MIYGNLPEDLGLIDIDNKEMMFWQYCPISISNSLNLSLPDNLVWTKLIVTGALYNFSKGYLHNTLPYPYKTHDILDYNIYLTVKTLYITENYVGDRFGWHTDGFGTEDINYIWYDRSPTQFIEGQYTLTDDCDISMVEMENIASRYNKPFIEYPSKHLLKLDQTMIHRVNPYPEEGMRSFVKVSFSKDKYNLEGNSTNPKLYTGWTMQPRNKERNHPSKVN